MTYSCKRTAAVIFGLGLAFGAAGRAQTAETLPNYVRLLPQVKAKTTAVDPRKGYAVKELKPDVYMITEGPGPGQARASPDVQKSVHT
jgi:hypothetical protein